jgi:hypothetical protein
MLLGGVVVLLFLVAVSGLFAGILIGINLGRWRAASSHPKSISPIAHQVLAALAALALLTSLLCAAYSAYFLSASTPTSATVVDLEERIDNEGGRSRWAHYRYIDGSGATRDGATSLTDDWVVTGKEIPIRYLTKSPWESRLDTFLGHWGGPLLLMFFAGGFGIASLARGRYYRWKTAKVASPASTSSH